MARRRHTPEQIIKKLREAEVAIAEGGTVTQAARRIGVNEQTFYRPPAPEALLPADPVPVLVGLTKRVVKTSGAGQCAHLEQEKQNSDRKKRGII